MTNIEQRFDRYFDTLDAADPLYAAHILDPQTAQTEEVRQLAEAYGRIKAEINQRFAANAVNIITPEGQARVHMDYIASSLVQAIAFRFEDWYFIGITEGMLALFAKSCSDLWRLNPLGELLGIELSRENRDAVFQFILLIELQHISNHELGHMFHGHCADWRSGRYRAEFSVHTMVAESRGMERQAKELEADGYAVKLLLQNLLQGETGPFMHGRVKSTRPMREFVLTLFLLSAASVLYYLEPIGFDPKTVRMGSHSEGIVRMNILMREILGWCKDNVQWPDAVPLNEFQWVMALVITAAAKPAQEKIWREQGAYLDSDEGRAYLNDIYKRRENLRAKMGRCA
jgi:hypothetical protein